MQIKLLNGMPIQEIVEKAADQNMQDLQDAVTVTDLGHGIYNLCVDGSCTKVTQEHLDFFGEILTRFQERYLEIIQNLIGGGM